MTKEKSGSLRNRFVVGIDTVNRVIRGESSRAELLLPALSLTEQIINKTALTHREKQARIKHSRLQVFSLNEKSLKNKIDSLKTIGQEVPGSDQEAYTKLVTELGRPEDQRSGKYKDLIRKKRVDNQIESQSSIGIQDNFNDILTPKGIKSARRVAIALVEFMGSGRIFRSAEQFANETNVFDFGPFLKKNNHNKLPIFHAVKVDDKTKALLAKNILPKSFVDLVTSSSDEVNRFCMAAYHSTPISDGEIQNSMGETTELFDHQEVTGIAKEYFLRNPIIGKPVTGIAYKEYYRKVMDKTVEKMNNSEKWSMRDIALAMRCLDGDVSGATPEQASEAFAYATQVFATLALAQDYHIDSFSALSATREDLALKAATTYASHKYIKITNPEYMPGDELLAAAKNWDIFSR